MNQGQTLLSIQYLRAIAALMVLVYHACRWAWRPFDIGAAGVDVFFVISGFILWTIAAERPTTPLKFLGRRAGRVVPLYWLLTIAVAIAALALPEFFFDAKPTVPHVLMSLFFIPHLNEAGQPFPLISAGWSLNYEAIFYLVFAAALLAKPEHRFRWLAAGLIGVSLVGIFIHQAYFLGFNLMYLQFLAGAWLARWRLASALPGRRLGFLLIGMALAGYVALAMADLFEDLMRPLLWGAPAFALVAGLVMIEGDGGLPKIGWLRVLGDASYSIYLTHIIVTEVLTHVMNAGTLPYIPIAIGASLAAGLACYYLVERPLLVLFRGRTRPALPSTAI